MARPAIERPNACWSMDFLVDSLFNGHRFRALTIVDNYSRECLAIEADQSMTGSEVAAVIERLVKERGAPDRIQCDNGSEFISRILDKWAYENGVTMDFSRPGKPMDNAMIESFNGSFRDECLNVNWFLSMEDAREKIERWRKDYNEFRPHSSLGDLKPQQFLDKFSTRIKDQKTPLLAGPVFGCGALSKGWAEMIRKVNGAGPLICPRCGGRMKVIAFLTEYAVVDRIIWHLKLTFVAKKPPPLCLRAGCTDGSQGERGILLIIRDYENGSLSSFNRGGRVSRRNTLFGHRFSR